MSDPTLAVLLFSSVAAAAAALGVLPLAGRRRLPVAWLGWANALAGGMMLGAAFTLTAGEDAGGALPLALGMVAGIAAIAVAHRALGTENLDLDRLADTGPAYGLQVGLAHSLHSASEGVAIGAAMAVDLPFGIFMALAIAAHNVPEAMVLAAVLRSRGASLGQAAGAAVATNLSQILLSVAVLAVLGAAPQARPWALGYSSGALIQLVLVEPLPQAYREAGDLSIAVVASVALGLVVLLQGFFS